MFAVKSIILFLVLIVQNSNQASVQSIEQSSGNNTTKDESVKESDKENNQIPKYPQIDPAIDEDAKLSTVLVFFCAYPKEELLFRIDKIDSSLVITEIS